MEQYDAAIGRLSQTLELAVFYAKAFLERCFNVDGLNDTKLARLLMANMNASQTIALIPDFYRLIKGKDTDGINELTKLRENFLKINTNRNLIIHGLNFPGVSDCSDGYVQAIKLKFLFRGKEDILQRLDATIINENTSYILKLIDTLKLLNPMSKGTKELGALLKEFNTIPPPIIR